MNYDWNHVKKHLAVWNTGDMVVATIIGACFGILIGVLFFGT